MIMHQFELRRSVAVVTAALFLTLAGCNQLETKPGVEGDEETSLSEPAKPTPPPEPEPRSVTLGEGTPLTVRTTTALSTQTVQTGDRFTATLEEPLVVDNWLIAPKGAILEGTVSNADKGGKVKGVASLSVRLASLTTDDGQRIAIGTNSVTFQAKTSKKKDAAKVGIGAGIGAAIGAIAGGGKGAAIGAGVGGGAGTAGVLLTQGDPAVVPAETILHLKLAAPVVITERQ